MLYYLITLNHDQANIAAAVRAVVEPDLPWRRLSPHFERALDFGLDDGGKMVSL